jgi:Zn-dependent peptidase ImmA (M78 family)
VAEEDRATEELAPERRLAARILADRGLSPPVPVEDLAAERLDISEEFFPADCDAVVFGLADADRPRLIVNSGRAPVRRRFTLAHELGHFVMAWHLGTIICHTDLREEDEWADELGDEIHRITEHEANGFASELLMPRAWLQELLASAPIPKAIEQVRTANVSAPAACFAIIDLLPPGNMLALLDNEKRARYLFRTAGADVPLRYRGQQADPSSLDAVAAEKARIWFGNQLIYWWRFEMQSDLIESDDVRSASEVLNGILDSVSPASEHQHLRNRINGIVGSAKNRTDDFSAERLHAELQQRFANRSDLREILTHSEFPLFLSRKAAEIAE